MSPKIRTFIFYLRTSYFRGPSFLDSTIIRAFKLGFYFLIIYTIHSQLTYIFSFFISFVFCFHTSLSLSAGRRLDRCWWLWDGKTEFYLKEDKWSDIGVGVAGACGRASRSQGHQSYIVGVGVSRNSSESARN